MTHDEYTFLASEVQQLESLLATIPEENVINRWGLQKRLQSARAAIADFLPANLAKKASLTFRGRPVFGSRGISAEFGAKASHFFTEAFSAVVAGLNENLSYMGPIPDKEKNQLLITGTAVGSFGFEFELPPSGPETTTPESGFLFPAPQPPDRPGQAMEKLEELFKAAAEGTDDDLTELVDEIHPRAVKKAAEFLAYIAEQEAWCGMQFQERVFRFSGADQVRTSVVRLTSDNIKQTEATFTGEFQGVLPKGRRFEFKVLDEDTVIRGKVGQEIVDPDVLNRDNLHRLLKVRFGLLQVGQARPRYTLRNLADISE